MATPEPGLDRHEWETEYAAIEEELATDPTPVLPEFADLIARMLVARGYRIDDPVERAGDEPDLIAEFDAAQELVRRLEIDRDSSSPGDVANAINGLRALYDHLIAERSAP